jgi:class 3 adenylate cyclase/tetratricopeptide (TPR) repeat protein
VRCAACDQECPPAARFCSGCGAVLGQGEGARAARDAVGESSERRQLTVLFCDLVGSTHLATHLDPEDWQDLLRLFQRNASAVVERFGGYVAQHLGDGELVYFGYPLAHDDAAERAVRAGLALVEEVARIPSPAPLAARVGVHTGAVVVSALGAGLRREKLALGETPHLAARLQAIAAAGTVVMSAATLRLVRGIFVTEELGAQRLQGFAEPIVAYRAVQPSGVRSRLEVELGHLTPFIGRALELGVLRDRWERVVEEGSGQAVLISGEAGIGKSRLAYMLRESLGDQPHTWLECRAAPYTQQSALRPVVELLEQGLAFEEGDSPEARVAKLEQSLEVVGLRSPERLALIAALLALPGGEVEALRKASAEKRRRLVLEALSAWTLALGELQPLVILFEDLQWADPSSLELLGRVIAQSPTASILLLCTTRPDFRSPWPERSTVTPLKLSRLTKRQARAVVTGLAAGRPLAAEVMEEIVTRADGVPLHLEELAKAALEPGARSDATAVPATLQDSLMARLDRLSAAKDVALRASVLGRRFPYALLAATAGVDEPALRQGLDRLVEAELLFARGSPPQATYTFKHALVQEVAYKSLLKRTRQELHGKVAEQLQNLFPERAASEPEVVARHYEAAARPAEAVAWYERAGSHAQERSAHEEAASVLGKAIELFAGLPIAPGRDRREHALQLALGSSLIASRGWAAEETSAAFDRARRLAERAGDKVGRGLAIVGFGSSHTNRGHFDRTDLCEEALGLARETGDEELALSTHWYVGFHKFWQGEFSGALSHCQRAVALYDAARHGRHARLYGSDPGVAALGYAAASTWYLGREAEALRLADRSHALASRLGDDFNLAFAELFRVMISHARRDGPGFERASAEMARIGEARRFPLWAGVGRAAWRAARIIQGDSGSAPEQVAEGLRLAATTGNQTGGPELLCALSDSQRAVGRLDDALATLELALALSKRSGQHFFDAELLRSKAELLIESDRGREEEAEGLFRAALETALAQQARFLALRAATSLGRLWRRQGRTAEARSLVTPLCTTVDQAEDARDLFEARALLRALA